ncbi:MAG: hypothetical protein HND53_05570 [Proteobacteria bacterium]|nr:hypothetical protein [Pseudomonadota bacterium]
MNIDFPNPVGLAAGFDRDGELLSSFIPAGFGFIEIGTVNVNSTCNEGESLKKIINNIQHSKSSSENKTVIGVSLGSLRDTIDDNTVADYITGMELFWNCSDYLVINLSRPGSSMRDKSTINSELHLLLNKVKQSHSELCTRHGTYRPVIVKIAIEYKKSSLSLPETLTIALELQFDGLLLAFENWPSSDDIVTALGKVLLLTNKLPLIVVGGIKTASDVSKILSAGAVLVQCYTLFVDKTPEEINKTIVDLL